MAANSINIDINLQTGGSAKKVLKDVKDIHSEVKATQQAASTMSAPSLAARAAPTRGEGTEYRRARGVADATGATARDFARESQGLGGLVRLYATYAANVFAVSAAFQSLSQAMNTDNMIRGLDQLGVASGQSLGNLAKQFVAVSGGAISLRESMEATTKAVSSGLSQEQFLKLGQVAQKASQALGLNMSDAVSRLTRGITKLEPELLDELGIFTKLEKATEDYAKSVGKTTSSLTDFERRQAFANAVLAEGTQKFGEINLQTNPYDKLLATLKDVSQTGLSLINNVLGPIVGLLSSSPVALAGILGALGVNLLKNVIPVLGQFRKNIQETAEEARGVAQGRATAAQQALQARRQAILDTTRAKLDKAAEQADAALDAAEKRFNEAIQKGVAKRTEAPIQRIQQILAQKDVSLIKKEDIDFIDRYGNSLKNTDNIYTRLATSIRGAQRAQDDFFAGTVQQQKQLESEPGRFTTAGLAARDAEVARQRASRLTLISIASEEARTEGMRQAWTKLNEGIKTEGLSRGQKALTQLGGAAAIAVGRLATFAGVLGSVGIGLLAAVGIYELLSSIFSKNSKEVTAFNTVVEELEGSLKTATATSEKFKDQLNAESIVAIGTAFDTVVTNVGKLTTELEKADRKAGWFDMLVDNFKRVFGQDLRTEFAKNLSFGIMGALETIDDPALKAQVEKQLSGIFKVRGPLLGVKIEEFAQTTETQELFRAAREAEAALIGVNKEYKLQTQRVTEAKEATKELETSYRDLANTFINRDPGTKFAQSTLKQLTSLINLLDTARTQAVAFENARDNIALKSLLPEGALQEVKDLTTEYARLQFELKKLSKPVVVDVDIPVPDMSEASGMIPTAPATRGYSTQAQQINKSLQQVRQEYDKINSSVDSLTKKLMREMLIQAQLAEQAERYGERYNDMVKVLDRESTETTPQRARIGLNIMAGVLQQNANVAQDVANNIETITEQLNNATEEARGLKNLIAGYQQDLDQATGAATGLTRGLSRTEVTVIVDKTKFEKEAQRLADELRKKIQQAMIQAASVIVQPLVLATQRSQIDIQKSLLQGLPSTPETVKENLRLELESIDLRRQEIQQMSNLVNALEKNRLSADLREAKQEVAAASFVDPVAEAAALKRVEQIESELKVLKEPQKYLAQFKELQAAQAKAPGGLFNPADFQDLMNPGAQQQLARLAGTEAQLQSLDTQKQLAQIKAVQDAERARYDVRIRQEQELINAREAENKQYLQSKEFLSLSAADQDTTRRSMQNTLKFQQAYVSGLEDEKKLQVLRVAATKATELGMTREAEVIKGIAAVQETSNRHAETNRKIALDTEDSEARRRDIQARTTTELEQQAQISEQRFKNQELGVETALQQLNLETEQLNRLKESESITQDAYTRQSTALQIRQLQLETYKEELSLRQQILQIEQERDKKLVTAAGEDAETIRQNAAAEVEGIRLRITALQGLTAARVKDLQTQTLTTQRQKDYEDIFKNSFQGLADTLLQWSQTGKWAGKQLFDSLIADIARYELRLQTFQLWAAARPALMAFLGFPGGDIAGEMQLTMDRAAKGKAYDAGVQKFAKGGMFTNSIVNEPTLFKFAKGTGLMGEAGPEAIMPLKRDSNGNLGVRASQQQQNVSVVINNNTQETATAQETVDNRGNRRIEVTVGDMVSQQITKPGSNLRETMRSNYNLRPAMIRR